MLLQIKLTKEAETREYVISSMSEFRKIIGDFSLQMDWYILQDSDHNVIYENNFTEGDWK